MSKKIPKTSTPKHALNIGNQIFLYDVVLPEQKITVHWHEFYEFEIILSGTGEILFNNKIFPIKPGTTSLTTPVDFHELNITSPLHILCIQFSTESISKDILARFCSLEKNIFYCNRNQTERTVSFINLLKDNFYNEVPSDIYVSRLLETLLLSFEKDFTTSENKYEHAPNPIQKAIVYIKSHFAENPQLSDIADMLFLNKYYFCKLFKETVGENYKDYLRKLKIHHAYGLLQHTNMSITQICFESGYSSQSTFNRDFKTFFGVSPRDIRKNKSAEILSYDTIEKNC